MLDQRRNRNRRAARVLLLLSLVFVFVVVGLGVKDVLDPPVTLCDRAPASVLHALIIIAFALPVMGLCVYLLRRPTRTRSLTILAVVGVVVLAVLACVNPVGYSFENGLCLSPFSHHVGHIANTTQV
jgi:uncharacterized membrane protein